MSDPVLSQSDSDMIRFIQHVQMFSLDVGFQHGNRHEFVILIVLVFRERSDGNLFVAGGGSRDVGAATV